MRRSPPGASGLCARRRRGSRPLWFIGRQIKRELSSFPTKRLSNQIELKCHSRLEQMFTCVINVQQIQFVYIPVIWQLQSRLDVSYKKLFCVNQFHMHVLIYQHKLSFVNISLFDFFLNAYYVKRLTNSNKHGRHDLRGSITQPYWPKTWHLSQTSIWENNPGLSVPSGSLLR